MGFDIVFFKLAMTVLKIVGWTKKEPVLNGIVFYLSYKATFEFIGFGRNDWSHAHSQWNYAEIGNI